MNFFEHQDQAHRKTQQLIGLFILSLLVMIVSIYLAAIVAFTLPAMKNKSSGTVPCVESTHSALPGSTLAYNDTNNDINFGTSGLRGISRFAGSGLRLNTRSSSVRVGNSSTRSPNCTPKTPIPWWNPQLLFWVSTLTLGLVGGGSWYKIATLRSGGATIAQELGGRLLLLETADAQEQQLLNVVQEMAIAAGMSVPAVYLLDSESGINAFAAGYTPNTAVIGVTRGSLEQLTRDELQGVIGHEFSHILNGDMRLNIQLMGIVHGLLFVYLAGRLLIETRSSDDDEDGKLFWVFGLALMGVGLSGVFFGRLIKSAVSRQREFLADASAVQFTRNPDGIAGALEKIGGFGSKLRSPYAEASSHMFFGNALKSSWFEDLEATHPPLAMRIQRIRGSSTQIRASMPLTQSFSPESGAIGFAGGSGRVVPGQVIAQVGTVTPTHYAHAQGLLAQLPEPLRAGLQERHSAIAILYALLLDPQNQQSYTQQLDFLRQVESADRVEQTLLFSTHLAQSDPRIRLSLLDLTVPVLRQGTIEENQQLFKCIQGIAKADGRWSLSEFVVFLVLQHRLNPVGEQAVQHKEIAPIWSDCLNLLSALARVGETRADAILYAFRSGVFRLPEATQQAIPEKPPACHLGELRTSLERLRGTAPKLKQAIVDACAHTVLLDNIVTVQEAELLRAIIITLDCPIPPFLNTSSSRPQKSSKST
jgi:Zn-dependent protease with chaperone function